jgi:hypothetical protein
MCKFNGTKLNKDQYVLLTGCKVKGENALYKVTRDIANDENYSGDNGYLLEKVKLNGEIKASGYTLYFYDNNGIKCDPQVTAKPLNNIAELKEANKELKAYLTSRDDKTIVNKINETDINIDLNAVGTEYKVKMINQVKFSTNGYNNNKAFKKGQYFKIKVVEGQRIRTELLNKTCESYCFDTAMKYTHGLNKNLTQEFINNCIVIEIDKVTKESLKETEKEIKIEEVKPIVVAETSEPVQEILNDIELRKCAFGYCKGYEKGDNCKKCSETTKAKGYTGCVYATSKENIIIANETIVEVQEAEKVEETQQENNIEVVVKNTTTQTTNNDSIEFTVNEDVHTKTGKKIFVAKLIRTLSKVEYINVSIRVKPLGGYYSSFKKGFLFNNDPTEALQKEFNTTIERIEKTEKEPVKQQQEIIINESLAKRAKENMSFDNYKEGSATQEYNRTVENITQKINEAKEQVKDDTEKINQLDYLLTKFKKDYANWINKHNSNGANHVSWMISGRGNYNMNKHNKWESREGKLWAEYNDIMTIENKIDKIVHSKKIIKSTDKDALEKLKEKLAEEQKAHDEMVNYNKQARKEKKEVYPAYMLSNSNQRIKNIKDRIAQLEKLEELKKTEPQKEIEINGVKIIDNLEANRLQIIFEGKPEENTRKLLKQNGFRWSPTQGAWQRYRSYEAERKAKIIAESLNNDDNIAI